MARIPFLELSGGMQRKTSSLIQQDNEAKLILNMHGDTVGARTKRLGYAQVGDTLQAGKSVLGLHGYNMNDGTIRDLATINNAGDTQSVLKYNNAGTWTNIAGATTLPAGANSEFATFIDYTFIVGSGMTTGSLTNLTYSTATNVTNAPVALQPIVFQDRLYLLNCTVAGTARPSRFYFSSLPSGTPLAITWNVTEGTGDYVAVNEDDGEGIVGGIVSHQRLYLWKETTMWFWDGSSVNKVADVGCGSLRTIRQKSGLVFWMDQDGEIWAFGGGQPKRISGKIEDITQGLSNAQITASFAEIDYDHYKCYVGDLTIDGRTYTNCELNYKISTNEWVIYSYNDDLTVYKNIITSGVRRINAGAADGEVHRLAEADDSVNADDGTPIMALYYSKPYDLGIPEQMKHIDKIYAITDQAMGMKVGTRIGDTPFTRQALLSSEPVTVNQQGYDFQLIATENSTHEPCVLKGFVVETIQDTKK